MLPTHLPLYPHPSFYPPTLPPHIYITYYTHYLHTLHTHTFFLHIHIHTSHAHTHPTHPLSHTHLYLYLDLLETRYVIISKHYFFLLPAIHFILPFLGQSIVFFVNNFTGSKPLCVYAYNYLISKLTISC